MMVLSVVFGIIDSIESNMAGYDAFFAHFGDLRTLMFVFVGVFSGVFIGEDFACRTFQGEVASGNARSKVLLSKTLLFLLGICIMMMIQILIVVVAMTLLNGFGGDFTSTAMADMVRAAFMFMLQICASAMICVLTCVLIKNKATIIAVNFMILVLIDGILQLIASMSDKALAFYTKTPLVLSLASSLPNLLPSELVLSILIAFATMIGLFIVSNLHFRKCELK
jgi:ABC-type transport system involved in multi-copper enzyme maturation permease subunit